MRKTTTRPFTVSDAMVLIAATGIASALGRHYWVRASGLDSVFSDGSKFMRYVVIGRWSGVAAVCLLSVSAALLLLRLRKPRPAIRQLARYAGFQGLAVVMLTPLLAIARAGSAMVAAKPILNQPFEYDEIIRQYYLLTDSTSIGPLIIAAWSSLAMAGRFRVGSGWLERSAFMLGILWLCLYAFELFIKDLCACLL